MNPQRGCGTTSLSIPQMGGTIVRRRPFPSAFYNVAGVAGLPPGVQHSRPGLRHEHESPPAEGTRRNGSIRCTPDRRKARTTAGSRAEIGPLIESIRARDLAPTPIWQPRWERQLGRGRTNNGPRSSKMPTCWGPSCNDNLSANRVCSTGGSGAPKLNKGARWL